MNIPFHPSEPDVAFQFSAYQVCPDSPQLEHDFLCVVASLEAHSDHPMATELVQIARLNNILPVTVDKLQTFPDRGVGALVTLPKEHSPRAVLMGTKEFLEESGLRAPEILESAYRRWEAESDTMVMLAGWDEWVRGLIKFQLKPIPIASK